MPIESVDLDEAAVSGPGADAVTDRVEATLQDIPDPTAPLSRGEAIAFEAVIRTDGTRPTMLVRDDAVDTDHPLAGDWAGTLTATRDTMRDRVGAVGRIEPANATARSYLRRSRCSRTQMVPAATSPPSASSASPGRRRSPAECTMASTGRG
ncbi:MAG: hypothetical protein ACRDRZ_00950 [Pseudonocardiaceae bacterium]